MLDQFKGVNPLGFYQSTENWIRHARLLGRTVYYEEFKFDETKLYTDPKGLGKFTHWKFMAEKQHRPPPTFIAIIPNGRVWGAKGAVITPDYKLLWDVSPDYGITPGQHPVFQEKRLPPLQYRYETAAVLTFCASHYYYHWMFDVLPRIYLLRSKKVVFNKLIINYNGENALPFQEETLSRLGVLQRQIIKCHNQLHLKVRKLVVPSLAGYTGHMPKWTCDFLRDAFMPKNNEKLTGYERLYLSRENAGSRRVINEDEVIHLLSKYGFRKIILESMTVAEQARLLSSAEIIVSAHGGGLTNLVFCSPGTQVLEIFSPNYVNVLYWILSNHVNLDYYYLIGEGERPPDYLDPHIVWEDIVVNLKQLTDILTKMGV